MTLQMLETSEGRMPFKTEEQKETILAEERDKAARIAKYESDVNSFFVDSILFDKAKWLDPQSVEIAKRNLVEAIKLPVPVTDDYGRWGDWATSMRSAIEQIRSPLAALHFAQTQVPFDHRDAGPHKEYLTGIYRVLLSNEFPWFFKEMDRQCDEKMSAPGTLSLANGERPISNMFFWHMRALLSCLTYTGAPDYVAEIGGGYGALARLWMLNEIHPIKRYIIFDIPESLFFSEVYLRTVFGDRVGYFTDDNSVKDCDIVLVPLGRMNTYHGRIDLVVSTGSMQEMSTPWAREWCYWLDRSPAKFFYSVNYMGQPADSLCESRNYWAPCLTANWSSIVIDTDPPLIAMMSPSRRFCELIFERKRATISLKDWSVYKGAAFNRRTYIEGLELVRQCPSVDNVMAFLNESYSQLMKKYAARPGAMPKEMLALAQFAVEQGRHDAKAIVDKISPETTTHTL